MRINNQSGETIVEVLISIATLSLTLGGAYVLAQRSSIGTQQAHERSEALKVAESFVERINQGEIEGNDGEAFCFNLTSNNKVTDLTPYPNDCKAGFDQRYRTTITVEDQTYTVGVTWDRLSGGEDNLTLVYRP